MGDCWYAGRSWLILSALFGDRFLRNLGGMVKFRAATVLNFNLEIEDK